MSKKSSTLLITFLGMVSLILNVQGQIDNQLNDPTKPININYIFPTRDQETRTDIDIRAIFVGKNHLPPKVIVGNRVFTIGDELSGFKIMSIMPTGIILHGENDEKFLVPINKNSVKFKIKEEIRK